MVPVDMVDTQYNLREVVQVRGCIIFKDHKRFSFFPCMSAILERPIPRHQQQLLE